MQMIDFELACCNARRQVLAVQAENDDEKSRGTVVARFVSQDGDHAINARVLRFLLPLGPRW